MREVWGREMACGVAGSDGGYGAQRAFSNVSEALVLSKRYVSIRRDQVYGLLYTSISFEHDLADNQTATRVSGNLRATLRDPAQQSFAGSPPDLGSTQLIVLLTCLRTDSICFRQCRDLRRGEMPPCSWGNEVEE